MYKYELALRVFELVIYRVKCIFTNQEINCGNPPAIENGIINGKEYMYSNVIAYRCTTGYRIRNGDYVRECSLDGTWSGIEPSCERKILNNYLKSALNI